MAESEPAQSSLFSWRREVAVTPTHAALWTVIVAATVLDSYLTLFGLGAGLEEGNALVSTAIAAFGPAGLWGIKLAAMAWLVAGWTLLSNRDAAVFLALFAAVTVLVAASNAVLVLGVVG